MVFGLAPLTQLHERDDFSTSKIPNEELTVHGVGSLIARRDPPYC